MTCYYRYHSCSDRRECHESRSIDFIWWIWGSCMVGWYYVKYIGLVFVLCPFLGEGGVFSTVCCVVGILYVTVIDLTHSNRC